MTYFWGVFELEDSIHVIPTDEEGNILEPHILDDFCDCIPEAVSVGEDGRIIMAHCAMQ